MAFKMGSAGGLQNEPNVVPMIDILLVLLIIFMIMQPLARKSVDLQLPDPTPQDKPPDAKPDQIILEILPNGTFAVNKEPMTRDNLARRLKSLRSAPEKISSSKAILVGCLSGLRLGDGMARVLGREGDRYHPDRCEVTGELVERRSYGG